MLRDERQTTFSQRYESDRNVANMHIIFCISRTLFVVSSLVIAHQTKDSITHNRLTNMPDQTDQMSKNKAGKQPALPDLFLIKVPARS
jgi:hypothetical protein